ncbi:hypothetical protein N7456_001247 [Penicillium angulare]|uniref:Uncharacterized protein n=1 Tax=Penicillium angulare TaxID=116970 RepID=A0A9W9KT11_9EURO|nr:hypothetical protein N7456_001247 [Penicillium angulare]
MAFPKESSGSILDMFSLKGKTVLVTGGTGGIGFHITTALAEAGANIISLEMAGDPLSENLKLALEKLNVSYKAYTCDLANIRSIKATMQGLWDARESPDILWNIAGIQCFRKIEDHTPDHLDLIFDVNCKAAYILSQEFGQRLIALGKPGKMIHMASMSSYVPQTEISAYAASKAGVRNMARAFSNEWAKFGITCNSVSPGFIQTEASSVLHNDPDFNEYVVQRTSAKRWGFPKDLIGTSIFLASSASDWITGEDILIDGGVTGR